MNKRKIVRYDDLLRGLAAAACAGLLVGGAYAQSLQPKDAKNGVAGSEKISLQLLDAASSGKSLGSALPSALIRKTADGVLVEILAPGADDSILKAISATGAKVVSASLGAGRVTAEVSDEGQLYAIGALDAVTNIRAAVPPGTSAGKVEGFADRALGADVARNRYGVNGAGVLVGVLSDSFALTDAVRVNPNDFNDIARTISSGATLSKALLPGTYTVVIQTDSSGVDFTYQSTEALVAGNCGSPSIDISGTGAILEGIITQNLDDQQTGFAYPGVLCAPANTPGSAGALIRNFSLFSFQVTAPNTTVSFSAGSRSDGSKVYMAIRNGCANPGSAQQEIACAQPNTAPFIINTNPQRSGDLPGSVIILEDGPYGNDEGAAMGELIHDIAPGADIAFHTAFVSAPDFADGIRQLAGLPAIYAGTGGQLLNPAKVIVDDVVYFNEPWFQPGIIDGAVESAVAHGSTYFSAAGNSGDSGFLQRYNDVKSGDDDNPLINGNDLHKWPSGNGYLPITVPPHGFFTTFLQWNQPFASVNANLGAQIDFDMYVTLSADNSGLQGAATAQGASEGRASRNRQGQTGLALGDAFEAVSYTNTGSTTKTVYLAIDHFRGNKSTIPQDPTQGVYLWVLFDNVAPGVLIRGVDTGTPFFGPTIVGHRNTPSAIAVGAVNYFDTPPFSTSFFPTTEIDPEPFSSRGGQIRSYFDSNNFVSNRTVFKPELACVDGNNTTFFPGYDVDTQTGSSDFDLDGFPNFFGTSAAAPNAAAVAALMLDANGSMTPSQIRGTMVETARDVKGQRAGVGTDDVSGAGLVNAEAALDYIAAVFGISTNIPSSTSVEFQFIDNTDPQNPLPSTEGWTFEGVPGIFTVPGAASPAGRLDLLATDNTNTFGFWKSPEIIIAPNQQFGGDSQGTINGGFGASSLYRVRAQVTSDSADPSLTPNIRMRASSLNFERTDELVVTSAGSGPLAASLGTPRTYDQFFTMAPNQSHFRLYFDVLGFSPDNQNGARVSVEEVIIQALDQDQLLNHVAGLPVFFANDAHGWSARNSSLGDVGHSATNEGLRLGPVNDSSRVSFGYFGSPEGSPLITLERSTLYLITFAVQSNASASQKAAIPTFRLRANDGTLNFSPLAGIDAQTESSNVPVENGTVQYKLYFLSPNELEGSPVSLSFDYLFVPGTGADPNITLTLVSLKVDKYAAPPQ